MIRASQSFFAAFVGWFASLVGFQVWMLAGQGSLSSDMALPFYAGLVTLVGWLAAGLPLALLLSRRRSWAVGPATALSSLVCLLAYLVTIRYFQLPLDFALKIAWWPALTAAFSGVTFGLLDRHGVMSGKALWSLPFAVVGLVFLVAT